MAAVAKPADLQRMGADEALAALYAAQWAPMVRLAWLLVRDQGVAEDVVQDALLGIHRRWGQLADKGQAVGYLRRSVVNACRSVQRHRKVESDYLAKAGPAGRDATTASAEELALRQVGNAAMRAAVERLPRRQREVLILRYYADLSEAQIADTLQISPGSVKAHAHRGLLALRDLVTDPRPSREDTP